jgi:hypothetical protein
MLIRRLLLFAIFLFASSSLASASPIAVNYIRDEIPPDPTNLGLPYYQNNVSDLIVLIFRIPQINDVVSINSFVVTISLFDDAPNNNSEPNPEHGFIQFAQPGPNIQLGEFGLLNGYGQGNPNTLSFALDILTINQVFPSILDGNFRIRVKQDTGDYYVGGASATIDAVLASETVPEPATMLTIATGLGAIITRTRRRRVASSQKS